MKTYHLLSAVLIFLLAAFLGVWLCSLLLKQKAEPESFAPPIEAVASTSSEESSTADIVMAESSKPEPASSQEEAEPKMPVFTLSAEEVYPGEYIVIRAYNVSPEEIEVNSPFTREPIFFESGDHLSALLPIKYTFDAGEYTVTLSSGDTTESFSIKLKEKDWQTQYLTVDSSTTSATIDNSDANNEYFAKAHPKKELFEAAPLWNGSFIQPVEGRITTQFGMQRFVNGVISDRHGGVDIAASLGTPVLAANSGKVIFAEYIALTGNTVCIEHGMGLKTWYYHMDSLSTSAGDTVEKGQQIGAVGSTGFSTGPHLHWAAAVFDVYIDPWSLIDFPPDI